MPLQHRQIQLQLGRKVLVEHRFAHAGPVRDLIHTCGVVTAVDEHLAGGDEKLPAAFVTREPVSAPGAAGARLGASLFGGIGEIAHQVLNLELSYAHSGASGHVPMC